MNDDYEIYSFKGYANQHFFDSEIISTAYR